jgi:hypothetical protein
MRSLLRRVTVIVVGMVLTLGVAAPPADALHVAGKWRIAGLMNIEEGTFENIGRINVCFGNTGACGTARNGVYRLVGKLTFVPTPSQCFLSFGGGKMTIVWNQDTPPSVIHFAAGFIGRPLFMMGTVQSGTFAGMNFNGAIKLRGFVQPCIANRIPVAGQIGIEDIPVV